MNPLLVAACVGLLAVVAAVGGAFVAMVLARRVHAAHAAARGRIGAAATVDDVLREEREIRIMVGDIGSTDVARAMLAWDTDHPGIARHGRRRLLLTALHAAMAESPPMGGRMMVRRSSMLAVRTEIIDRIAGLDDAPPARGQEPDAPPDEPSGSGVPVVPLPRHPLSRHAGR